MCHDLYGNTVNKRNYSLNPYNYACFGNIHCMKLIDFIIIRFLIFIACFVALSLSIDNLWASILIALVITFILSLIIDAVTGKRKAKGYNKYLNSLIIGGNKSVFDEVKAITGLDGELKENRMLLSDGSYVFNCVKFGIVTADEIIRYYNQAAIAGVKNVYIISRQIDRKTASIMNYLDIDFIHISTKLLYHRTNKSEPLEIKNHNRKSFISLFRFALARTNAKRYLFTSAALIFMSIFTPLKIYYLVLGGIGILLSVLCLTPLGDDTYMGKKGIFERRLVNSKRDEMPPDNSDVK